MSFVQNQQQLEDVGFTVLAAILQRNCTKNENSGNGKTEN